MDHVGDPVMGTGCYGGLCLLFYPPPPPPSFPFQSIPRITYGKLLLHSGYEMSI